MKITYLTLLLLFFSINTISKIDVKTYNEKTENGYIFYADNNEYCPVSIKINFDLNNLKSTEGNGKFFILPARTKRIELTKLITVKKGKKYGFKSSSTFNYGDLYLDEYDKDFEYSLPFSKGEKFRIQQGYNGTFSHQNKNALDFLMPKGTIITAVREGVVFNVIDINDMGCAQEKCKKYSNKILIYHSDGTMATYGHIKKNGAKVKKGDIVKTGQEIAKSGNTGWSTNPHLHFEVYLLRLDGAKTIETKFKVGNGGETEVLIDNKEYSKNYND